MYKILVADNDRTAQKLLKKLLPGDSFKIEAASHGKAVLKKVADGSVDIMIIEVHIAGNEEHSTARGHDKGVQKPLDMKENKGMVSGGDVEALIVSPDIEGYEIIRQVQKMSRRTRIIAMTEGNSLETQRILRSGETPVFFYALKPLVTEEIKLAIYSAVKDIDKDELPFDRPFDKTHGPESAEGLKARACRGPLTPGKRLQRPDRPFVMRTFADTPLCLMTAAIIGKVIGKARKEAGTIVKKIYLIAKSPFYIVSRACPQRRRGSKVKGLKSKVTEEGSDPLKSKVKSR